MAREFQRSRRIEERIQRLLSDVIRTQVRDPRVEGVVITHVRVSRDLGVAWVYYASYEGNGHLSPDLQAGLDRASGFLRSHLARELNTRTVPEIRFRYDDLGEKSRELDRLIDTAVGASKSDPHPGQNPEGTEGPSAKAEKT
ncbi:MAG: 30S ribosome-binding factor RbfA [Gammaproteobacteria bacterium]|nr:30S ribosome-binding factor RbfA [Gammaproteobacteria bacterium]MCP5138576.1 30S ribosome-binding factor RbfA [Chromatiales bacterium]